MLSTLKKNAVISLIIGIILIICGILFVFIMPEIGESIKNFAIGLMIVILILLLIFPDIKKKQTKLITTLLIVEVVIALLVAIMFVTGAGGNPSLWIGLIIYTHGLVDLIGGYFGNSKQKPERFIIAVALVTIGVYIFTSGIISNDMLLDVLLIIFLAPGLFFTLVGALGLSQKPKKEKKAEA
jgi:uncharacterized membrane protein